MIKILKDVINYEENILVSNIITSILKKTKKRQYDKQKIADFESMLDTSTPTQIIEHMFQNNLNLKEVIGTNYRQIQVIYKKNKNDITLIQKDREFELLHKEVEKIQKQRKSEVISYLKMIYQNSSRKKGELFKKIFKELREQTLMTPSEKIEISNKSLFDGIAIYENIQDLKNAPLNIDFIYIPEEDQKTKEALDYFSVKHKNAKGRDILIRYRGYYFLGEAKEVHESGGAQDKQFIDMEDCVKETNLKENLIGFGIIYGGCLRYENKYQEQIDKMTNAVIPSQIAFHLKDTLDYLISENK